MAISIVGAALRDRWWQFGLGWGITGDRHGAGLTEEITVRRSLSLWGALGTTIYLLIISMVVFNDIQAFRSLELNTLGDFLAGVFGPLGFLWLVLGFIQQGRELNLSTSALKLQADELKASVEQQIKMVEAQNLSLENHERSLDPLLMLQAIEGAHDEDGEFYYQFEVMNKGAYCDEVAINIKSECDDHEVSVEPMYGDVHRKFVIAENFGSKISVAISYRRVSGREGVQKFNLTKMFDQHSGWYSISKLSVRTQYLKQSDNAQA